jgi:hypothetical protein
VQTRSDYEYEIRDGVLIIEDLCLGNTSVTNDIENVLAEIRKKGGTFDIACYIDSGGDLCQVREKADGGIIFMHTIDERITSIIPCYLPPNTEQAPLLFDRHEPLPTITKLPEQPAFANA